MHGNNNNRAFSVHLGPQEASAAYFHVSPIQHLNIVFALAVKAAVLLMGALGVANMWEAVFADVGVSVIAILNAMRALKSTGIK